MKHVEACITVTEKIIALAHSVNEMNREEVIEDIQELLDQRMQLMLLFKEHPPTVGQQELGKQLLEKNNKMEKALQQVMDGIQKDMSVINQKKKSVSRYSNPYAETEVVDGMFYDKRK